jgi:hypothetical protein
LSMVKLLKYSKQTASSSVSVYLATSDAFLLPDEAAIWMEVSVTWYDGMIAAKAHLM